MKIQETSSQILATTTTFRRLHASILLSSMKSRSSQPLTSCQQSRRQDRTGSPNLLLKQFKHELAPILTRLFRASVDQGIVPSDLKKAMIKPIKKAKKPRSDPASFRPVSLTSGISKILERIIKPQVKDFLEVNKLLCDSQHGFRQKRSCISQLLDHYSEVLTDLEEGKVSEVIYLDFAKAFNSVDHMILSRELKRIGIKGEAGIWIHDFLSDRVQQVIAENMISKPEKVVSGVPQGTVLGPVLFLIMINTLSELDLTAQIKIFADDTRVAHGIKDTDDIKSLQDDLDKIFTWKNQHNMKFNSDKFEHVSHGRDFKTNIEIPVSTFKTMNMNMTLLKIKKWSEIWGSKSRPPPNSLSTSALSANVLVTRVRGYSEISTEEIDSS